jgi:hypothetical protein
VVKDDLTAPKSAPQVITRQSTRDRWVHTNPGKIDEPAVARQLVDAAW